MISFPDDISFAMYDEFEKLTHAAVTPLLTAGSFVEYGMIIPVLIKSGLQCWALFDGDSNNDNILDYQQPLVVHHAVCPESPHSLVVRSDMKPELDSSQIHFDLSAYDNHWMGIPRRVKQGEWMISLGTSLFVKADFDEKNYVPGSPVLVEHIVEESNGSMLAHARLTSDDLPTVEECRRSCADACESFGEFGYGGNTYRYGCEPYGKYWIFMRGRKDEVLGMPASCRFRLPQGDGSLDKATSEGTPVNTGSDGDRLATMVLD